MPSATSSPSEPVDTTSISRVAIESPKRMTEWPGQLLFDLAQGGGKGFLAVVVHLLVQ